jgi:hypothetical protein
MREVGVSDILDEVKRVVAERLELRMFERRDVWQLRDLPDASISTIAVNAGSIARPSAGDGINAALQIGINRTASSDDHERPTPLAPTPVPNFCPHCGPGLRKVVAK